MSAPTSVDVYELLADRLRSAMARSLRAASEVVKAGRCVLRQLSRFAKDNPLAAAGIFALVTWLAGGSAAAGLGLTGMAVMGGIEWRNQPEHLEAIRRALPDELERSDEVVDFLATRFDKRWKTALTMGEPEIVNRDRWDVINQALQKELPITVIADLLAGSPRIEHILRPLSKQGQGRVLQEFLGPEGLTRLDLPMLGLMSQRIQNPSLPALSEELRQQLVELQEALSILILPILRQSRFVLPRVPFVLPLPAIEGEEALALWFFEQVPPLSPDRPWPSDARFTRAASALFLWHHAGGMRYEPRGMVTSDIVGEEVVATLLQATEGPGLYRAERLLESGLRAFAQQTAEGAVHGLQIMPFLNDRLAMTLVPALGAMVGAVWVVRQFLVKRRRIVDGVLGALRLQGTLAQPRALGTLIAVGFGLALVGAAALWARRVEARVLARAGMHTARLWRIERLRWLAQRVRRWLSLVVVVAVLSSLGGEALLLRRAEFVQQAFGEPHPDQGPVAQPLMGGQTAQQPHIGFSDSHGHQDLGFGAGKRGRGGFEFIQEPDGVVRIPESRLRGLALEARDSRTSRSLRHSLVPPVVELPLSLGHVTGRDDARYPLSARPQDDKQVASSPRAPIDQVAPLPPSQDDRIPVTGGFRFMRLNSVASDMVHVPGIPVETPESHDSTQTLSRHTNDVNMILARRDRGIGLTGAMALAGVAAIGLAVPFLSGATGWLIAHPGWVAAGSGLLSLLVGGLWLRVQKTDERPIPRQTRVRLPILMRVIGVLVAEVALYHVVGPLAILLFSIVFGLIMGPCMSWVRETWNDFTEGRGTSSLVTQPRVIGHALLNAGWLKLFYLANAALGVRLGVWTWEETFSVSSGLSLMMIVFMVLLSVLFSVILPFFEEMLFRDWFFKALRGRLRPGMINIIQASLFTIAHLLDAGASSRRLLLTPYLLFGGLMFGASYQRQGIQGSLMTHVIFNSVSSILILADGLGGRAAVWGIEGIAITSLLVGGLFLLRAPPVSPRESLSRDSRAAGIGLTGSASQPHRLTWRSRLVQWIRHRHWFGLALLAAVLSPLAGAMTAREAAAQPRAPATQAVTMAQSPAAQSPMAIAQRASSRKIQPMVLPQQLTPPGPPPGGGLHIAAQGLRMLMTVLHGMWAVVVALMIGLAPVVTGLAFGVGFHIFTHRPSPFSRSSDGRRPADRRSVGVRFIPWIPWGRPSGRTLFAFLRSVSPVVGFMLFLWYGGGLWLPWLSRAPPVK